MQHFSLLTISSSSDRGKPGLPRDEGGHAAAAVLGGVAGGAGFLPALYW